MPRYLSEREQKIVVDALRRAAAETRTIYGNSGSPPAQLAVAVEANRRRLEDLAFVQDRLAGIIGDERTQLRLERRR